MPRRPSPADADRTPGARLHEGGPHGLVGYQLAQATIVTTQVFVERVGGPLGLRPVEYTVLALVTSNPDVTARQLSQGLGVTPPNIAVWVDKLEARGLVERTRSAADARKQPLRATAAGVALARDATQRLRDGEAEALARVLTPAEHAMLLELAHKAALARSRA